MPLIEVKLFDRRLEDPETPKEIIKTFTDGLCSVIGEEVCGETWVVIEGVSPRCWGMADETADSR